LARGHRIRIPFLHIQEEGGENERLSRLDACSLGLHDVICLLRVSKHSSAFAERTFNYHIRRRIPFCFATLITL